MKGRLAIFSLIIFLTAAVSSGQTYIVDIARDSARSDKITGGRIVKAAVSPGDGDVRVTINLPSFQLTLWQGRKELGVYPIGIGKVDFPVPASLRSATSIEWNPVWIPPSSEWIERSSTVRPGEIILPTDPRNPLGKIKIPLGYGYLIHQAKGVQDMGNLVSHGCVRVLQRDLYDLSEKIMAARNIQLPTGKLFEIKRTKKTLPVALEPAVPVEITYDTMIVEAGELAIYPDIYNYKKNTVDNLRNELRSNNIDDHRFSDARLRSMIAAATGKNKYVVSVAGLRSKRTSIAGRSVQVVQVLSRGAVK
jgi:hypothetical protein